MLYFYPLGTGVTKQSAGINLGTNGWSHPTQYFSCCMGTGIEARAKLHYLLLAACCLLLAACCLLPAAS